MTQDQIEFKVLFRNPEYPVIVISKNTLTAAFNIKNWLRAVFPQTCRKMKPSLRLLIHQQKSFGCNSH